MRNAISALGVTNTNKKIVAGLTATAIIAFSFGSASAM
jgi:hypothetical protein